MALGHLQEWAIPEALPGILAVGLGMLWGVKFVLQCVSSKQGPPCFVTGHTMPGMAALCFKVRAELGATGAAFPAFCTSPGLCSLLGQSLCPLSSSGLELGAVYPHLVRLQPLLCLPPRSVVLWGKACSTLAAQAVLCHLERLQPSSQDVSLQDVLLGCKPCPHLVSPHLQTAALSQNLGRCCSVP